MCLFSPKIASIHAIIKSIVFYLQATWKWINDIFFIQIFEVQSTFFSYFFPYLF